jgi:hypothetical protein
VKHFLLLLIASIAVYGAWQMSDPTERRKLLGPITRHGGRIAAIVILVALLLWAAAQFPASPII